MRRSDGARKTTYELTPPVGPRSWRAGRTSPRSRTGSRRPSAPGPGAARRHPRLHEGPARRARGRGPGGAARPARRDAGPRRGGSYARRVEAEALVQRFRDDVRSDLRRADASSAVSDLTVETLRTVLDSARRAVRGRSDDRVRRVRLAPGARIPDRGDRALGDHSQHDQQHDDRHDTQTEKENTMGTESWVIAAPQQIEVGEVAALVVSLTNGAVEIVSDPTRESGATVDVTEVGPRPLQVTSHAGELRVAYDFAGSRASWTASAV
ncbi:hypothetical protein NKG05_21525 [Oerskovia sp. M15]